MLVTGNFFFSRSVFKKLVLQTRKNQGLFEKGLTMILISEKFQDECDVGGEHIASCAELQEMIKR